MSYAGGTPPTNDHQMSRCTTSLTPHPKRMGRSIGGDGTFHECVNGIMKRVSSASGEAAKVVPPLAFIPAGTGTLCEGRWPSGEKLL